MFLLAVTPGNGFDPEAWRGVLHSGVDAFMIRERSMEARALLDAARWCRVEAPAVALWVNGRLDVALAAGAGFHAPEAYPAVNEAWIPLSRPLHEEAQWEGRRGAAQVLVAPVFETAGKGPAWGPARLHRLLDGLPREGPRILALGGVTPDSAPALRHPRLNGLAAIRPFWSGEPEKAVRAFRAAWA